MKEMTSLLEIADKLLGPNGCPWDLKQTFYTLQPYLLEETHELLEAIDLNNPSMMAEEVGDVLYALVFIAKLAEKQQLFEFKDCIDLVSEKLIRRHPHVFGTTKVESTDEVVSNWEAIKQQELKDKKRKTVLDGIPPSLPILARSQKVIQKLKRHKGSIEPGSDTSDLGRRLWALVCEAEEQGVDAESALRRVCLDVEESYRKTQSASD